MVHVELQTPIPDVPNRTVRWETLVSLRVENGHAPVFDGDQGLIHLDIPVVSLRTGQSIHFEDAPEDWARSLPLAYRAGDLVAAVIHDDDPIAPEDIGQSAEHHHGAATV